MVICENVSVAECGTPAVWDSVQFTKEVESQIQNARVALVADQPAVYGLLRMYEGYRNPPFAFAVFRERQAALDWLESSGDAG